MATTLGILEEYGIYPKLLKDIPDIPIIIKYSNGVEVNTTLDF
jgi:hypothetical protein